MSPFKCHWEACFSKIRLTFKHYIPKSKYRYLLLCKLKPNQFPLVWSQVNIADNQIKPTFTDLDSKTGYWDFWENGLLARRALLGSTYLSKKDLVYLQRLKLITPWSVVSLYVAILVHFFLWEIQINLATRDQLPMWVKHENIGLEEGTHGSWSLLTQFRCLTAFHVQSLSMFLKL